MRKLPYAYKEAAWFLAACAALGSALGALYAVLRCRLQPGRP